MKEDGEERKWNGQTWRQRPRKRNKPPKNKRKSLDAKGEVRLKSRNGKTDEPNSLSEEIGGTKAGLGIPRQAFLPAENRSKLTSLFRQPPD